MRAADRGSPAVSGDSALGPPVFDGDLPVRTVEHRGGLCLMSFAAPAAFAGAAAGQFVLLGSNRSGAPLLPRPISIVEADPLRLAVAAVGEGTRRLAEAGAGEPLHLVGPLGASFAAAAGADLIVCDASHFGTLLALATARAAAGAAADVVYVTQPDGSPLAALDAPVLSLLRPVAATLAAVAPADLEASLHRRRPAALAAGAADPVMAVVQRVAEAGGWRGEAALQAPMACGLGVCQACVRPLRSGALALVCMRPILPLGAPAFAS